jgi:hypothetical protein
MPLRFLHILRDTRLKQIKEKNERLSQQQANLNARGPSKAIGGIDADALEELLEEVT